MQVQPYLFFAGRCAEAVEFYREALGAEVDTIMRYQDSPTPLPPDMCTPASENQIMHVSFRIGNSLILASDDPTMEKQNFSGFSVSLWAADEAEAERLFAVLADGGKVRMPMAMTFFSARFGMLEDRFGVPWMISVA